MEVSKLIREIEEYVTLYPFPKKQNNNGNLNNNAVDKNNFGLGTVYISEASDSDGMLDAVLEHCSEDTLDYTKVTCELNTIEISLETYLKDAEHRGTPKMRRSWRFW